MTNIGIAEDPMLAISLDEVGGKDHVNKFGRNADIDTVAPEDIWDGGGIWVAPTAARTHDIASDNAADAIAGAGARRVEVLGLNSSFALDGEMLEMAGVANVPTTKTYVIIFRMKVRPDGAGVGARNVGTITATAQVDGTVTAQINPVEGQTFMAVYQIPAGKTGRMMQWFHSLNKSGGSTTGADQTILIREFGQTFYLPAVTRGVRSEGSSAPTPYIWKPPLEIPEKAIVKVQSEVLTNNIDLTAGFDIVLTDIT